MTPSLPGAEIEAKFTILNRKTFKQLQSTDYFAGYAAGDRTLRQVVDTYIDTAQRSIMLANYACRIRKRETKTLLTLKALGSQEGSIQRRSEYEVLLTGEADPLDTSAWPDSPAKELVQTLIGDALLDVLFTIRQNRSICNLYDDARVVAELSLDAVRFDSGVPFFELEVELRPDGTEKELEQIAETLKNQWALIPASGSKFERGLAWKERISASAKRRRPDIKPSDPMSEAGRKTLCLHLKKMLAHEPGTRSGHDIEDLHDMRVATRRMRAAFRVFGPYFQKKSIKPHLDGLKQTGRMLGTVRDLDVFEEKAQIYLKTLPPNQIHDLDPLLDAWHKERESARIDMLDYLDSETYGRFLQQFDRFLSTPGAGVLPVLPGKPAPRQVCHVAPQQIFIRYKAVRAYEPLLETATVELLHALRIDMKQLRYALEFFSPVLSPEAELVIEQVKLMQDHLGDLNDTVTAQQILRDFLAAGQEGQSGLQAYLTDREQQMQFLLDTFPAAWERFSRTEVRRNIALAVAEL
ncbi:MAG: CHAD domain-containing protein [Anaerolineales bacterium]|nr:CHAD domain-containing protein [Anaerolineales bacterium]